MNDGNRLQILVLFLYAAWMSGGCATVEPAQKTVGAAVDGAVDTTQTVVSNTVQIAGAAVSNTVHIAGAAVSVAAGATEHAVSATVGATRDAVATVISPMRSAIYRSTFGDVLKVTYSNQRATLTFNDGTTKSLDQIPCDDGFKYSKASATLWTKEKKLVLEMDGDKTEYAEAEF